MPDRARRRVPSILLALLAGLVLTSACESARDRRERIRDIDLDWRVELKAGSVEEMIENIRALGDLSPKDPYSWASIAPLCRQVLSSPSALVRADALRAAWKLGSTFPVEHLSPDTLPTAEFNKQTFRFEELLADPEALDKPEILELAEFMGRYRFEPSQSQYAVNLSDVVMSRALWHQDDAVGEVFLRHARGSLFHALTLVTLQAAGDSVAFVREEALTASRHLQWEVALQVLGGALQYEDDSLLLLSALDSVTVLAPQIPAEELERLLNLRTPTDVAVRRAMEQLRGQGR